MTKHSVYYEAVTGSKHIISICALVHSIDFCMKLKRQQQVSSIVVKLSNNRIID
uniref:Uncharacterized protein n=1 Tax=Rhizophora mucronata TaxID=61149 RepID=A0A2P2N2Y7_RHIMU